MVLYYPNSLPVLFLHSSHASLTPPSASPHLTSRLPQPHLTPHPRGFQIHKGVQREDNSLSLVQGLQISCGRRSLVPSFYTNLLYSISLFSTTLPLVRIASLFKVTALSLSLFCWRLLLYLLILFTDLCF